jgi:hypothetical protein
VAPNFRIGVKLKNTNAIGHGYDSGHKIAECWDLSRTVQGLMSALGQKQTLRDVRRMSALTQDIRRSGSDVQFVPIADISQVSVLDL